MLLVSESFVCVYVFVFLCVLVLFNVFMGLFCFGRSILVARAKRCARNGSFSAVAVGSCARVRAGRENQRFCDYALLFIFPC